MALIEDIQVKEALGLKPADTSKDSLIAQAIPAAESLIQDWTNRSFALNVPADPATARVFRGEESGITTVDDFVHGTVTGVNLTDVNGVVTVLTATQFMPQPSADWYPVGWYVETAPLGRRSPQMGFTRNEDVLFAEGKLFVSDEYRVTVTAKWGWPAVPQSVQQAAIWTTIAVMENPRPFVSEAIQGYSRTREAATDAIPARARDALGRYVKG